MGRVGGYMGRVGGQEPGAAVVSAELAALDARVEAIEGPIDGWLEFGGGVGLGTVATTIYMIAGSNDIKTTPSAAPNRIVLPDFHAIDIVGYKLVVGAGGTGGATVTLAPRINGVASGKTITFVNDDASTVKSESWEESPIEVPVGHYVDVPTTKSGTVGASATGIGLALAFRWRASA